MYLMREVNSVFNGVATQAFVQGTIASASLMSIKNIEDRTTIT